jgi:hypothetical protein
MDSSAMQWGCFLNAFAFALFLSDAVPAQGKGLCEGQQATINCLKQNFRELYQKDYKRFWDILYSVEGKTLSCRSIPATTEFLELAKTVEGNAEVSEYFNETIETKLLQSNPQCFLDALFTAHEETKRIIIEHLRTPTFAEETKIREILSNYRTKTKYRDLLEPFFKEQCNKST